MTWLRRLPVILLLMLTPDGAAAADVFSVRCEGGAPSVPYFATFDIDAKAVVFETPPLSIESYSGIGVHAGEITSMGDGADGKIEFMLRAFRGRIDLIFDRIQNTMFWPGFDSAQFRPQLIHQCTVTPPRSILSFRVREPILNPVSVRCEYTGYMYFTMDAASKQALFERGREGRMFEGEVTDADQDEITLSMNFEVPRKVVWSKSRQTITIEGIEGDANRPRTVMQCQEVAPRTMMVYHERRSKR
ncbi:hypothetical protein [Blastochloris viridis]|uniref:Uncharacterized protein n=1 Tax=Blastochloris viridis TaxID=1079 RepID=A0A0P0JIT5_BLAVI|nr:hypothetical protein [Blastochloris viridis]ALK08427.1 hypothetical protein BVIR_632 [Blastochloris viridis]CUU41089.1 hypothetical protein BVIRIDIS_00760 [Blastochloris viridis]